MPSSHRSPSNVLLIQIFASLASAADLPEVMVMQQQFRIITKLPAASDSKISRTLKIARKALKQTGFTAGTSAVTRSMMVK